MSEQPPIYGLHEQRIETHIGARPLYFQSPIHAARFLLWLERGVPSLRMVKFNPITFSSGRAALFSARNAVWLSEDGSFC